MPSKPPSVCGVSCCNMGSWTASQCIPALVQPGVPPPHDFVPCRMIYRELWTRTICEDALMSPPTVALPTGCTTSLAAIEEKRSISNSPSTPPPPNASVTPNNSPTGPSPKSANASPAATGDCKGRYFELDFEADRNRPGKHWQHWWSYCWQGCISLQSASSVRRADAVVSHCLHVSRKSRLLSEVK